MIQSTHKTASAILRFSERRGIYILSAVLFRFALEVSYALFISDIYAYSGFVIDFNLVKYIESWAIYLGISILFPAILTKASDYLFTFLFSGLLAPLLVFYAYADQSRLSLYYVLLGSALILIFRKGRPIRLPVVKYGQRIGLLILFGLAGTVSFWYALSGGLAYFNLDLTEVYEFRRASAEVTGGAIMSYVNVWAPKVAGPILLAYSLWKRLYVLAGTVFALHVFWFGISAHKAVLFYPILVVFLWYWFSRTRALSIVFFGMSFVVLSSLVFYLFTGDPFIASMFIRRVFFVIANNTFSYYEFFSENPHVYWSNSLTAGLVNYPYHVGPAELIGDWRGTGAHVNNTFLSTGYMHAGMAGILFYGLAAGLLFRVIDSVVWRGVPLWFGVAAIIVPAQSLILSADLPTALLTHGMGLAVVSLFLLREPRLGVGRGQVNSETQQ